MITDLSIQVVKRGGVVKQQTVDTGRHEDQTQTTFSVLPPA